MKLTVKMYGDHGGELNAETVSGPDEDQALRLAKIILIQMVTSTTLSVGDRFVIEAVE